MKIVVSDGAAHDLKRLREFLHDKNPQAVRRAALALIGAIDSLADAPERGRPSGVPGLRELIVPFSASAYVIRYAVRADRGEVVIIRIWHGREDRG